MKEKVTLTQRCAALVHSISYITRLLLSQEIRCLALSRFHSCCAAASSVFYVNGKCSWNRIARRSARVTSRDGLSVYRQARCVCKCRTDLHLAYVLRGAKSRERPIGYRAYRALRHNRSLGHSCALCTGRRGLFVR